MADWTSVWPVLVAVLVAASASSDDVTAQPTRVPAAIAGDTHVLVVFARFADDLDSSTGCRAGRGWPTADPLEPLPAVAHTLFDGRAGRPFADSSASAYFFEQSLGQLRLTADVFPRVVVSSEPTDYYHRSAGRGYGYLTQDIISQIDDEVDFRLYDTNPRDGVLDHIFIILRKDRQATFTGVADLAGADRVRGRPNETLEADGVTILWPSSGSYILNERPGNVHPQSYMTRMVAHEYGHHIWNPRGVFGGHVPAIRSNGYPSNDTNMLGYTLMAGRGGGRDGRGDLLISAPERDAIGWLRPLVLDPSIDSTKTVRLGDFYSTGDAVRIDVAVPTERSRVSFYLTNRQRVGWFDTYRVDAPPGCTAYDLGFLRTTGLHIKLTEWFGDRLTLDVLTADNKMTLSNENADYDGDLFGPGSASQITPFTTPSTSLPDGTPTWVAIDSITMVQAGEPEMQFRFISDFRKDAVVREDSRITARHGRVAIEGDLVVTDGAVLEVGSEAHLDVSGDILISPDASVKAKAGAMLTTASETRYLFADWELPR